MNKALDILAKIWSIALYPMFMPLYGIILYCYALHTSKPGLPPIYFRICILGTAIFTLVIPIILLLFLLRKKYIDSIHIDNPKQRTIPYIYTLVCYGFWAYFSKCILHLTIFLFWVIIGAMIALLAVTIINHWWKISAHLTGIGGLAGGICSYAIHYSKPITPIIAIILLFALLLMYARLYLNAHTPMQVVCGFLLGLISIFTPTLLFAYA